MTTTAPGEYRIRAQLYRALGDGAPLPPSPEPAPPPFELTW